jgi:ElaB/YqjD/DUF883 family membrane-anchored ribosome-binding protein
VRTAERFGPRIVVFLYIGKDFAMTTARKSTVNEIAETADRTLETVTDGIKSMVSERPLVTLGMAAGVGLLLGFLWRR